MEHFPWHDDLDPGIAPYVLALVRAGIHTVESCEGGEGHCFPEPTVVFSGQRDEGFRALAVALQLGFPVSSLRRAWPVIDGEPTGPYWELAFYFPAALRSAQSAQSFRLPSPCVRL